MRHSGIEWIGEIPKEWNLTRAKSFFTQRNSKGNESAVLLSATQKQGMMPQSLLEGVVQVNNNTDLQTFKTVHINDYVISLRSFQGGFEKSNYEGVCSPAYQVFYNIAPIDHNYFWQLFKSYGFVDKINSLTVGIREGKNIQYKDFANMILAVPPLSEQQKIANYLDKVCGEVDEMIALQEQMIEELKAYKQSVITEAVTKGLNPDVPMKDSGIAWIGEVPEGWNVSRLKYFSSFINGFAFSSDMFSLDKGCKVIRIGDISQSLVFEGCVKANVNTDALQSYRIKNNDIVIAMSGATTGKCCVAKNVEEAYINQRVGIIRCDNYSYVYYSLQTDYFMEYINLNNAGSAQPNVSGTSIGNFPLLVPSESEQQSIASYLDEKCAEIDDLIAIKQAKIEELKEYKKSIIYEYVTGKKEVV